MSLGGAGLFHDRPVGVAKAVGCEAGGDRQPACLGPVGGAPASGGDAGPGQTLPALARHQAAGTVQAVLPDEAGRIQAEPNWPALAATLSEAARAGHDPVTLLHRAVDNCELTTADSLTDILLWRLRHEANLPAAPPPAPQRQSQRPAPPPTAPALPLPSQAPIRRR
jgi:hypothetical protein